MAPLTRETESPAETSNAAAPGSGGTKPQPVAVEIPIIVNGARTIAGGDKREPFSENSQTVLVFASGAVIRLLAPVGPGQLLFVTNEKSKKEVVCQVVKSKQNGAAGGYVELKFTEPAADFWGIRLPGVSGVSVPGAAPSPLSSVITMPAPAAKSLEQKLNDLKVVSPSPAAFDTPAAEIKPLPTTAAPPVTALPSVVAESTLSSAPAALPTASLSKVPTLSEFLTHGNNGLELRAQDKPKTASPAPAAKVATDIPKNGDSLPTVQLSSVLLGAEGKKPSAQAVAPGTSTFDFAVDEVKIPAWLEPLARNSADAATVADVKPSDAKGADTLGSIDTLGPVSDATTGAPAESDSREASFTISSEGPTPKFGSSLAIGADSASAGSSSGFNWKIILLAVGLIGAAAAAWYWYSSQTAHASSTESSIAPVENSGPSPVDRSASSENGITAAAQGASPASLRPSEKPANSLPARSTAPSIPPDMNQFRDSSEKPVAIEQPAKKPALGDIHLAAPKLNRKAASESTTVDPLLNLGGVAGGDSANLTSLASKTTQPSAPIVVGGEVKPARLLSSTPPAYPQLARTQRVSGAVVIDASIDASGQVAATRVISGPALLHQAAMDAVKQWKYQPATLNGQPTAMHLSVTVQFRLQ